jgi:hypothetical protein
MAAAQTWRQECVDPTDAEQQVQALAEKPAVALRVFMSIETGNGRIWYISRQVPGDRVKSEAMGLGHDVDGEMAAQIEADLCMSILPPSGT